MISASTVRILAFHASYRCQGRGRCCTSDWPVPIEADRLPRIERAVADGIVQPSRDPAVIRPSSAPPDTPAVVATAGGRCVFHRPHDRYGCDVHRALGHDALPLACRQFPRVTVVDPRGASVTLSHYCPTAARLLDADTPIGVVRNPPAFPAAGEYVGLDVRHGIPPLLRPDLAMDWESWWAWERQSLDVITTAATTREALTRLEAAVEHVRQWSPNQGPLGRALAEAFDAPVGRPGPAAPPPSTVLAGVLDAIPDRFRPRAAFGGASRVDSRRRRRLLAAHTFANWTAHLGLGLRTWLRSLQTVDALVDSGLGVDEVDLLLRHLADPHVLARAWSTAEQG